MCVSSHMTTRQCVYYMYTRSVGGALTILHFCMYSTTERFSHLVTEFTYIAVHYSCLW